MINSSIELITLEAGVNYAPTFVSTDKRIPSTQKTSIGYYQIGETQQYGKAMGPIFKIEFVDLTNILTATHVKIWGLDNINNDVPLYPITYLTLYPQVNVYLKKFEFCDSNGDEVDESNNFTVVGHKKRSIPLNW
jgi:hypothetical protein